MSFNQNDLWPITDDRKRTTKANVFVAIVVLIFFLAGAYAAWRLLRPAPIDVQPGRGRDLGAVFQAHGRHCSVPHVSFSMFIETGSIG
jgi:hypothetical protein